MSLTSGEKVRWESREREDLRYHASCEVRSLTDHPVRVPVLKLMWEMEGRRRRTGVQRLRTRDQPERRPSAETSVETLEPRWMSHRGTLLKLLRLLLQLLFSEHESSGTTADARGRRR